MSKKRVIISAVFFAVVIVGLLVGIILTNDPNKVQEETIQEGDSTVRKPLGPPRFMKSQDVSPTVPVLIDYYTLYPNPETGKWETWRDRYEYDDQIMRRLKNYN